MRACSVRSPRLSVCCLWAILTAGCADLGCWSPFDETSFERVPGVPVPYEQIQRLRQLAKEASSSDAEQRARVAAELSQAIRTEEDPGIRAEIVRTLAKYPTPAADAVLRGAIHDLQAEVREAACEAWATRGGPEAVGVLCGALDGDVDVDVRLAAARALGRLKDPRAVAALGGVLEDKDPAMQYRAVESLRRITGKDLGNDVNRWRQYVRGELSEPDRPVSLAERLRQLL